ncbi:MAG: hypothetical protein NC930_04200 [Candidatus Omnitrophica bacterium]|nr:hypothetical protein [Candidatus Omnitrophota bacterium]
MMKVFLAILILLNICVLATNAVLIYQHITQNTSTSSDPTQTLGAEAGKAVRGFTTSAQETLQSLKRESEKTQQNFEALTQGASKELNAQAAQTATDFKKAAQTTLEAINRELQRYNEVMKKSQNP